MSQILFGRFGRVGRGGLAWLFSSHKKQVDWRLVGTGMVIQVLFAAFVLLTPFGEAIFGTAAHAFVKLSGYTTEGAKMIFGDLATADKFGFIFVFQVLPTVIF
ncbi:MAG: Na+ dependent nucleoside transporter N-terminal domain-containing protein, partial [Lysobacteraceae bacterium]